jgi:hypothetical protein
LPQHVLAENARLHARLASYQKAFEALYSDAAALQLRNEELAEALNSRCRTDVEGVQAQAEPRPQFGGQHTQELAALQARVHALELQNMQMQTQIDVAKARELGVLVEQQGGTRKAVQEPEDGLDQDEHLHLWQQHSGEDPAAGVPDPPRVETPRTSSSV